MIDQFVFLLVPFFAYDLWILQPRLCINDGFRERLDTFSKQISGDPLGRVSFSPERVLVIGPSTEEIDSCPCSAFTAP